jgi:hypothetical protein
MKKLLRKIDAALAAVAFAEEGEADAARQTLADAAEPAGDAKAPRADPVSRLTPRAPLAKGSRA